MTNVNVIPDLLYPLLTLIVSGCILQGLFIFSEYKKKFVPAVIFKGLASCIFCILAFISCTFTCTSVLNITIYCLFIGAVLGALGDVLLNLRFVFKNAAKKLFLSGIAAFLSGHIFYVITALWLGSFAGGISGSSKPEGILICLLCTAVASFCFLYYVFKKFKVEKAFKIFGVVYISCIFFLTSLAVRNAVIFNFELSEIVFLIGVVFFTLSDIILIFNTFGNSSKFSLRIANLSLYYIGQILITCFLFFWNKFLC